MSRINNGFTGLFWLNENSTEIIKTEGEVEFHSSDVVMKNTVLPLGTHRSGSEKPYSLPRGRVEVENGKIVISVGLNCPDSVIEQVIQYFVLGYFRNVIEVRHNSFWDKRFT